MKRKNMQAMSRQNKYALRTLLQGQRGAVACLTAHPLGTHVASGGEDGTRIWHLPTSRQLKSPTGAGERGLTTAVVWIVKPDDTDDGLAFGTEDGYLCIWKRSRKDDEFTEVFCNRLIGGQEGQEVSAMAYDASSGQLAVVHRSEAIHRFIIDPSMKPVVISSVTVPQHWPQAVAFGQTGVKGPEIWSFGRDDGNIHVLNDDGKILKSRTTGSVIGHAIINVKEDTIILDDVSQGVALYRLSATDRLKTFVVPCGQRRSRNVSFHEGGRTIVTGSDHGNIYIFDRRTGEISDIIHIGIRDWVQSIATVEVAGVPLIIIGRSGENIGKTELQVWEKVNVPLKEERPTRVLWEEGRWLICVMLSVLFILENILNIPVIECCRHWTVTIGEQIRSYLAAIYVAAEDDVIIYL